MYNVEEIRKDFPVLNMLVNGKPNTFLDSGASAQKPQVVIDRMVDNCYLCANNYRPYGFML